MNIISRKFLLEIIKIVFIILIVRNFESFDDFYNLKKVIGLLLLLIGVWFLTAIEVKASTKRDRPNP